MSEDNDPFNEVSAEVTDEDVTYFIRPGDERDEDDPAPGLTVTLRIQFEQKTYIVTARYIDDSLDEIGVENEGNGRLPAQVTSLARTRCDQLWCKYVSENYGDIIG